MRATCLCGADFADNDRDTVVTALMLHLAKEEGWLTARDG